MGPTGTQWGRGARGLIVPTLFAAVAVALGAVSQAATGFGFSLVSAPFLIAVYRAPTGVQLNLLLSAAINLALLARERRHADVRAAGFLLLPAVAATAAIGYAVRQSQSAPLTLAAGLVCLGGVAAVASGRRFRRLRGPAGTALVGAVSGGMNVVAGIGGPPVVLFGINAGWSLERARPTMQLFFWGSTPSPWPRSVCLTGCRWG